MDTTTTTRPELSGVMISRHPLKNNHIMSQLLSQAQTPKREWLTGTPRKGQLLHRAQHGFYRVHAVAGDTVVMERSDREGRPGGQFESFAVKRITSPYWMLAEKPEPWLIQNAYGPWTVVLAIGSAVVGWVLWEIARWMGWV